MVRGVGIMFIRKKKYEELENILAEEQIKVLLLSSRLAILEKKFEDILEENTKLKEENFSFEFEFAVLKSVIKLIKEIDNEETKKRQRKSKKRAFEK